ncbi:MOSC domain-containing protein [Candidatus Izimaplasma bacterium]|nr:MOSC domain-containing protein [Candidatus Izimaplasma bacterium]
MAKVISVNTSLEKGVVKNPVKNIKLVIDHGVEGDAHAGNWHRQVSLLAIESYRKMIYENKVLPIGSFAENITTEGIELFTLPVGTKLQIGETLHEVTQIGKECHSGCAIQQQVGKCVMPKEGIFTIVLKEGTVKKGDKITIIS